MDSDPILVAGATNQKSNAAFKREALAFRLIKVALDFVECCGFELRVGAQWQIENRDGGIVSGILEPGKTCARAHTHRRLQAHPQARREDRLGNGARSEACQACQSQKDVNTQSAEHEHHGLSGEMGWMCLPGPASSGNAPITIRAMCGRLLAIS